MIVEFIIKNIMKESHLDLIFNYNEKYVFVLVAYLGVVALLYGLTEIGVISIGSFLLCSVMILALYFIFKKMFNKTIKKLRKENDNLNTEKGMRNICKNNDNEFCKRYRKKREQYYKDVNTIYNDYNKSI